MRKGVITCFLWLLACGFLNAGPDAVQVSAGADTNADGAFEFVVIGDRTGSGPASWSVMHRAIREINRLNPDFVIMIGDIIEGNVFTGIELARQWQEARQYLDSLRSPVFFVPGNHDIFDAGSYHYWRRNVGNPHYSFDHAGCHFLVLNTEAFRKNGEPGFGADQIRFIRNDIDLHRGASHFFIIMHQPVWLMSGKIRSEWNEIVGALGSIPYSVIAGHLHVLAETEVQGNRYLIVGPTGGRMRLSRNPAMGLFHHYTRIRTDGSAVSMTFVEPGGQEYGEALARDAYRRYLAGMMLLNRKALLESY